MKMYHDDDDATCCVETTCSETTRRSKCCTKNTAASNEDEQCLHIDNYILKTFTHHTDNTLCNILGPYCGIKTF